MNQKWKNVSTWKWNILISFEACFVHFFSPFFLISFYNFSVLEKYGKSC